MIKDLSTVDRCILIDSWITKERDRHLMKRKLIDGITYEKLAEEMQMSTRGVKYAVKRCKDELNKHI